MVDHVEAFRSAIDEALAACAAMRPGDKKAERAVWRASNTLALIAVTSGREVLAELDQLRAGEMTREEATRALR